MFKNLPLKQKIIGYFLISIPFIILIAIILNTYLNNKVEEYYNYITKKEAFIDIFQVTELDIYTPDEYMHYKDKLASITNCIEGYHTDYNCFKATLEFNPYLNGSITIPKEEQVE